MSAKMQMVRHTAASLETHPQTTSANLMPASASANERLRDLGTTAYLHALDISRPVLDRVLSAVTLRTLDDAQCGLARVVYSTKSRRFRAALHGEAGHWALLAPVVTDGAVVDVAAFDLSTDQRRTFFGFKSSFAIGWEEAVDDARWSSSGRVLCHHSIWSWLRAECVGCVPVDWDTTALEMKRLGCALSFTNEIDAHRARAKLRDALQLPEIFVRRAG